MKRITSALLAVLMIFTLLPVTAVNAADTGAAVSSGETQLTANDSATVTTNTVYRFEPESSGEYGFAFSVFGTDDNARLIVSETDGGTEIMNTGAVKASSGSVRTCALSAEKSYSVIVTSNIAVQAEVTVNAVSDFNIKCGEKKLAVPFTSFDFKPEHEGDYLFSAETDSGADLSVTGADGRQLGCYVREKDGEPFIQLHCAANETYRLLVLPLDESGAPGGMAAISVTENAIEAIEWETGVTEVNVLKKITPEQDGSYTFYADFGSYYMSRQAEFLLLDKNMNVIDRQIPTGDDCSVAFKTVLTGGEPCYILAECPGAEEGAMYYLSIRKKYDHFISTGDTSGYSADDYIDGEFCTLVQYVPTGNNTYVFESDGAESLALLDENLNLLKTDLSEYDCTAGKTYYIKAVCEYLNSYFSLSVSIKKRLEAVYFDCGENISVENRRMFEIGLNTVPQDCETGELTYSTTDKSVAYIDGGMFYSAGEGTATLNAQTELGKSCKCDVNITALCGEEINCGETLYVNTSYYFTEVNSDKPEPCAYLRFAPTESGKYRFIWSYHGKAYEKAGVLYDENLNVLVTVNDRMSWGGEEWQKSLTYTFEAGKTYFLSITKGEGNINVEVNLRPVKNEFAIMTDENGLKMEILSDLYIITYPLDENSALDYISWRSSDESIAKVDNNGMVTSFKNPGRVVITGSSGGFERSVEITVTDTKKRVIPVYEGSESVYEPAENEMYFLGNNAYYCKTGYFSFVPAEDGVYVFEAKAVFADGGGEECMLLFDSIGMRDNYYMFFNNRHKLQAGETCYITAFLDYYDSDNVASIIISVKKAPKDERITIAQGEELTIGAFDIIGLTVNVYPGNAEMPRTTWRSSDSSVVEVSNMGVIYPRGFGEAVITASAGEGIEATVRITVSDENIVPITFDSAVQANDPDVFVFTADKNGVCSIITEKNMYGAMPLCAVINGTFENIECGYSDDKISFEVSAGETYYIKPPQNYAGSVTLTMSQTLIKGDANGDGKVDINDVTQIQKKLAGFEIEDFRSGSADVTGDGDVTIEDATEIQKYLAGFENVYGINN